VVATLIVRMAAQLITDGLHSQVRPQQQGGISKTATIRLGGKAVAGIAVTSRKVAVLAR